MSYDAIVVGGGPAGAAAAITAARLGARVLLLERGRYPRHKVCGEFVSPESLSLLSSLLRGTAGEPLLQEAPRIRRVRLFCDGATLDSEITPPAASLARFQLDHALWRAAQEAGADCRQQAPVTAIAPVRGGFRVLAGQETFTALAVIDASGRWSNLARFEQAPLSDRWLGVKAHFAGEQASPEPAVDLYFFAAGYCGVQPVGEGHLNACAMVRAAAVEKKPDASLPEQIFALHPHLRQRSRGWRQVSDLVTTSPLLFRTPEAGSGGILRAGDAAGFIDPFAGDGISLALRTGAMAAEALRDVWAGKTEATEAARHYAQAYARRMLPVFKAAARVRRLLDMPPLLRRPLLQAVRLAGLGRYLIKTTRLPM